MRIHTEKKRGYVYACAQLSRMFVEKRLEVTTL